MKEYCTSSSHHIQKYVIGSSHAVGNMITFVYLLNGVMGRLLSPSYIPLCLGTFIILERCLNLLFCLFDVYNICLSVYTGITHLQEFI